MSASFNTIFQKSDSFERKEGCSIERGVLSSKYGMFKLLEETISEDCSLFQKFWKIWISGILKVRNKNYSLQNFLTKNKKYALSINVTNLLKTYCNITTTEKLDFSLCNEEKRFAMKVEPEDWKKRRERIFS